MVWQVGDLIHRAIWSESKEIAPNRNTSEWCLRVVVASNMKINEVINVLSESDLRVWSFMAVIAGVIVMDDVSGEPLSVLPLVITSIASRQVSI